MTESATGPAGVVEVDRPGWYPTGQVSRTASWDGEAWSGATADDPTVEALPKWKHHILGFLGHAWFWTMVGGQLICVAVGFLAWKADTKALAWASFLGFGVFLAGSAILIDRHLEFTSLPRWRFLTGLGVISGVVASAVALAAEFLMADWVGSHGILWLAGPIEESAKLAVPFGLLAFGPPLYRNPRVGLYLVAVTGLTFGVVEGAEYQATKGGVIPVEMALVRPTTELAHIFLTGFAAAVIWLAARRAGRAATVAGTVAFLIVVGIHSFHDGIFTLDSRVKSGEIVVNTLNKALALGAGGLVWNLVLSALFYLLLRHGARELMTPSSVAVNPPHWRPTIKQWGVKAGPGGATPPPTPDAPTQP